MNCGNNNFSRAGAYTCFESLITSQPSYCFQVIRKNTCSTFLDK